MQGPSWIALLERIPVKLHDTLALTLVTGAEIMMQSLLRLESDFAIIRGRMAGSIDAGRVIILPYDQIVNLAFTKRMLEPEVQAVFGETLESPSAKVEGEVSKEEAGNQIKEPEDQETDHSDSSKENQVPAVPAKEPLKNPSAPPSKSILLARLRARLAEQGK
jgi:hypothetical protein